jgi:hypothetical protein
VIVSLATAIAQRQQTTILHAARLVDAAAGIVCRELIYGFEGKQIVAVGEPWAAPAQESKAPTLVAIERIPRASEIVRACVDTLLALRSRPVVAWR